jgi:hypothetical protein
LVDDEWDFAEGTIVFDLVFCAWSDMVMDMNPLHITKSLILPSFLVFRYQ